MHNPEQKGGVRGRLVLLVGSHCLASIAYRTVRRTEGLEFAGAGAVRRSRAQERHSPEHCVIGDPAKRPSLVKTSKPTVQPSRGLGITSYR